MVSLLYFLFSFLRLSFLFIFAIFELNLQYLCSLGPTLLLGTQLCTDRAQREKRAIFSLSSLLKVFDPNNRYPAFSQHLYPKLFIFLLFCNLIALYCYFSKSFALHNNGLLLVLLAFSLWYYSYSVFIIPGNGKFFTSLLTVNLTYPSLSMLLTNIEILTHTFRPVTLVARMWVNIWVGHNILGFLSSIFMISFATGIFRFNLILIPIPLTILFLYEVMVAVLQSFVFVYLCHVYFRENLEAVPKAKWPKEKRRHMQYKRYI